MYPVGEVGWHPAELHDFNQAGWDGVVEGTFDILCEEGGPGGVAVVGASGGEGGAYGGEDVE